jgi:hypothetical protein
MAEAGHVFSSQLDIPLPVKAACFEEKFTARSKKSKKLKKKGGEKEKPRSLSQSRRDWLVGSFRNKSFLDSV